MKLAATPATGILLSPADQETLPVPSVRYLTELQRGKTPSAEEMKSLAAGLPVKAAGGEVLRTDLEPWLLTVLRPFLAPEATFYFGDRVYYLPTARDITEAWSGSGLDRLVPIPQRFDCDDFAFAFKGHCSRYAYLRGDWSLCGLCLGFASGRFHWRLGRHAANLFIAYDNGVADVKLIEPSNGTPHVLAEVTEIRHLFI